MISLGCSGAGTAAYTKWWEPDWLGVGRHQVKLGRGNPSPLRMLQMSDFHASEVVSLGFIQRAIQTGLELKPDLICLTSDFITSKYRELDRFIDARALRNHPDGVLKQFFFRHVSLLLPER